MKKLIMLIMGIVVSVSCSEDFIDLNPPSNLNSSGFYKTQTDMNQAVLSAYSSLRTFYNSQAFCVR